MAPAGNTDRVRRGASGPQRIPISRPLRRTWEGNESDIRRIDPESGKVLARLAMPDGVGVSGLESDGAELFYAGGGSTGKVRAVRRPKRKR
jgi:hypothetical protein